MLDIKLMYHELDFCSCHRLGLSLASRPAPLRGLLLGFMGLTGISSWILMGINED